MSPTAWRPAGDAKARLVRESGEVKAAKKAASSGEAAGLALPG